MDKRCCTCHRVLPTTEFNRRAAAADGLQARCRDCSAQWYEQNREAHRANVRRRNAAVRAEAIRRIAEHLVENPCVDCSERDIRCLDFDHRDPATKVIEVARMLRAGEPWQRIEVEIAKCDVRCANCHRRVTAERGSWWRQAVYEQNCAEQVAASHARLERVFRGR